MKGISIAIETVIYIVLAVIVLTLLLFFFTSQAGPAETRLQRERERTDLCSQYVSYDSKCEDTTMSKAAAMGDKLTKLMETCFYLNERGCTKAKSIGCVQVCCRTFCSRPPPTT